MWVSRCCVLRLCVTEILKVTKTVLHLSLCTNRFYHRFIRLLESTLQCSSDPYAHKTIFQYDLLVHRTWALVELLTV